MIITEDDYNKLSDDMKQYFEEVQDRVSNRNTHPT